MSMAASRRPLALLWALLLLMAGFADLRGVSAVAFRRRRLLRGGAGLLAAASAASVLLQASRQGSALSLTVAARLRSMLEAGQETGASRAAASNTAAADAEAVERPLLFLFIGILSGAGQEARRAAVRAAWADAAQQPGQVVARFVLSEHERTAEVDAELAAHGDIIFCPQPTNYSTILHKTYAVGIATGTAAPWYCCTAGGARSSCQDCSSWCSCIACMSQPTTSLHLHSGTHHRIPALLLPACGCRSPGCASSPPLRLCPPGLGLLLQVLEHATLHHDTAYVMKTDDDSFVNVPALLRELAGLCTQPGCRGERLYLGSLLAGAEEVVQEGHRWNNPAFAEHTGEGVGGLVGWWVGGLVGGLAGGRVVPGCAAAAFLCATAFIALPSGLSSHGFVPCPALPCPALQGCLPTLPTWPGAGMW